MAASLRILVSNPDQGGAPGPGVRDNGTGLRVSNWHCAKN